MPDDHIRYDLLIQDALRGVMRAVLIDAAAKGLPGDHHFYITFDTRVDGVRLSARLKASYPEEMTIVLQHQFWELAVSDDDFDVGLAFNGIPERLHVPFRAVKAFMDPSVQFAIPFAVDMDAQPDATDARPGPAKLAAEKPRAVKAPSPATEPVPKAAPPEESTPSSPPAKEDGSAEVVRLDRFRKK